MRREGAANAVDDYAPPQPRFTALGDDAVESRVGRDLRRCVHRLREALPDVAIDGIALGGSHGRGEGGLRRDGSRLVPYNDYNLFAVTPVLPWPFGGLLDDRLRTVASALSDELGVDVEITRIDRVALRRPPEQLAVVDLRAGHVVLHGPAELLAEMPDAAPTLVPPAAAPRLILDRTAGLVRARALLARAHDLSVAERVARATRKAWLAAADARLIVAGRYHPSPRERQRIVAREPLSPDLRARYEQACRERAEGAPSTAGGNPVARIAEAADALREALDEVETTRVGVGTARRPRYRKAVVQASPSTWRDKARDLRDVGRVAFALPLEGSRVARLFAVLPCVLDHLAQPDINHSPCAWLVPSRLLGVSPRARGELDSAFLRRWRALP